ncbi:MAG: NUDIX hydrolase [Caulobacterales bacterium]|nr:NUDIX hydrolase [Caulobacterales bacterium]
MTDAAPRPRAERVQVAALCWRSGQDGMIEILLVTSRDTGRWVTPKGGRMPGKTDAQAAAEEAWEEAGVLGEVQNAPIGTFRYMKRLKRRAPRPTEVNVFALRVTRELADWKEVAQRSRRWFTLVEAAAAVDEAELGAMIQEFRPPT